MDYSPLNHKFHFVLLSRFFNKGPFHIKEPLLCCKRYSNLVERKKGYYFRGYREILIDIKETEENDILFGAYYEGGYWDFDKYLDDIDYCKKCYKNLLEYIKEELNVNKTSKTKLFQMNAQEIRSYVLMEIEKDGYR